MENKIPQFLIKKLEAQYGKYITLKILGGFSKNRKTTFRVNTLKSSYGEIEKVLKNNNYVIRKCEEIENGVIIEKIGDTPLSNLDIYKDGKIYVQSLSSMIPPIYLNICENENVLDMAAAPRL